MMQRRDNILTKISHQWPHSKHATAAPNKVRISCRLGKFGLLWCVPQHGYPKNDKSLNKQELSTMEKPWELGFSPTFSGTKPIWTITKKQHPLPLTDDMLRASPFTAACAAHMNVLFRLTQLHMCNSFFFQSGKRPQHGCPESPWNQ